MARAGLSRLDVKRARDSLLAQGQHPSIDAIRIALGNTGSKTTIHRHLKELEEEEGTALSRVGSASDAILDLVSRLAARLHEEAQAVVDQQVATATAQRQQVRAEADKLSADLAALRAELAQAHATIANVRTAHSDTQAALQQRTIEAERAAQQIQDLTARLTDNKLAAEALGDHASNFFTPHADYNFSMSAPLAFAKSHDSIGLQLADVIAGFCMRYIKDWLSDPRNISGAAHATFARLCRLSDNGTNCGVHLVVTNDLSQRVLSSVWRGR